jgi:hypothetical protein
MAPTVPDFTARPNRDQRLRLATGDPFSLVGIPAHLAGTISFIKGLSGTLIDKAQGIQIYLWNVFNRIVEHKGDPH